MAYVSYEQASSAGTIRRMAAPRFTWGRLGVIALSLTAWVGLAFAFRALF
ncbi:MAG: hypothetical protein KKC14_06870 [Alphaproteobacteria bacterium]|nr:hypothetical protein [Alphaproteobacteria bacterium]